MARADLLRLIRASQLDADFRNRLFLDAEAALDRFPLSPQERAAVLGSLATGGRAAGTEPEPAPPPCPPASVPELFDPRCAPFGGSLPVAPDLRSTTRERVEQIRATAGPARQAALQSLLCALRDRMSVRMNGRTTGG
jgi:hypothetical protein